MGRRGAHRGASLAMLVRYYPMPKQGFRQALQYVAARREPTDQRIGLTLGGKAVRFDDPSILVIEDKYQLRRWLDRAEARAWVIYSFERELRQSTPELYSWLITSTSRQASFRGVIGDGDVVVRLWLPPGP